MVCRVEEWEEPSDTENLNQAPGDTVCSLAFN